MSSFANIALAGFFMGGMGVSLAAVLAVANRRLFVYEDPRIDQVEELLPHANCGACGTPGCRAFAETLVDGEADPGLCTVNAPEANQAIADLLGVEVSRLEKRVARVACAGGSHVAYVRARYQGLKSCRAAALVAGGGKGCTWGCLGFGDCAAACQFEAIHIGKYGLPAVDGGRCTACGDCCDVCPKDLLSLQAVSHRLWVACNNHDGVGEAEAHCELVCTACGRCSADAPEDLITLQDNLAVIDYEKNGLASKLAIERCPTGAIVWLDDERGPVKGAQAKRVTRKEPLPQP